MKRPTHPILLYGTAWKKERTSELVVQAVRAGFRGVDTACQPKHYHEPGVGDALKTLAEEGIGRDDLFLQTKFTPLDGHDPRQIPYDPAASLPEQVRQSFRVSLQNLGTDRLDSLVLHSPLRSFRETLAVWREFEAIHRSGGTHYLGISNCYEPSELKALCQEAAIRPTFLQNRFCRDTGYDRELREFCLKNGIVYQSFWTLTANPHILMDPAVLGPAKKLGRTPAQIFFRYLIQMGILPLTGTTSLDHMKQDLAVESFSLPKENLGAITALLV